MSKGNWVREISRGKHCEESLSFMKTSVDASHAINTMEWAAQEVVVCLSEYHHTAFRVTPGFQCADNSLI